MTLIDHAKFDQYAMSTALRTPEAQEMQRDLLSLAHWLYEGLKLKYPNLLTPQGFITVDQDIFHERVQVISRRKLSDDKEFQYETIVFVTGKIVRPQIRGAEIFQFGTVAYVSRGFIELRTFSNELGVVPAWAYYILHSGYWRSLE